MDRCNRAESTSHSPPSDAWLFAQQILGRPMPRIVPQVKANAQYEKLGRLAQFSLRHAQELRRLQAAETQARHDRELLEWTAQISAEAQDKLRALQQTETREREARQAFEQFREAHSIIAEWDEADHPRAPMGSPSGGQWVAKGGGGSVGTGRSVSRKEPGEKGQDAPNPHMLALANTWWQTKSAIERTRRDIAELPGRIARERAQLRSGGRAAPVHAHQAAKAQRDLETAKALVPELEKQLADLEQQYSDSGYDDVHYSTWTPGETLIGGEGIEQVGHAVSMGGTPAGLKPTGIEVDIASAALAGPAILRLGKAILSRAIRKAPLPLPRRASFGQATSANYRKSFLDAHPHLEGKVVVHHGVEQQALKKYPGVVTEAELHSLETLRGIPKGTNSETHLRAIRKEWNAFYEQHPSATKQQLLDKASEIDEKYGYLYEPPIR